MHLLLHHRLQEEEELQLLLPLQGEAEDVAAAAATAAAGAVEGEHRIRKEEPLILKLCQREVAN